MVILFIYCYIASSLPVQTLLQPRDYINAHQLFIAFALLIVGVFVSHPQIVAPAVNLSPQGAPPFMPFLFVVIACGAISGFHALVSSGTSSKQCYSEVDARFVGYGSMLMEGVLATLVIIAVAAAKEYLGPAGIYGVAAISGLTDMDAITLSTAQLTTAGKVDAATCGRVILIAAMSNLVFKGGIVSVMGDRRLLRYIAVMFGTALAKGAALLWLWPI